MYASNLVFGYGSLMNISNLQKYLGRNLIPDLDFRFCHLHNFQRCWNIAMDNSLDLPNYKYYVEPKTGNRPAAFVTFLNVCPIQSQAIMGILFRVSEKELQNLDRRERNYRRIDATNLIDYSINGKAWVYIGLDEAQQRYQQGLQQSNVMIAQDYFNSVHHAYYLLGKEAFTNYLATTEKPRVPIVNLKMCQVKSTACQSE
ncbi:MAG: hypothetical protein Tsb0014_09490 [Pleurocapsa sp.]